MYETLILVDDTAEVSADALSHALAEFASRSPIELQVHRSGGNFRVLVSGFSLRIHRNSLPEVLEESAEIAANFASGKPEQAAIARCGVRFEIDADDDPSMDFFNDYCLIVEAIEGLGRVYTFDQASAEFMNL